MSQINIPNIEEEIYQSWTTNNTFQETIKATKEQNRPLFNFYDGPPFATGSPHYGHLLAATIKDTVCRFQTINGHHVPRINGWDMHGLPIEQLGEKTLGIKTTDQIYEMGIDKFNQTCRSLVNSCVKDWEKIIPRMGRWVDFENSYQTMDFEFMASTWGVFKRIFDKGLIYRSITPMPYSTGCASCLSHFEAKSNYQDTQDPSVVIKFQLKTLPMATNCKMYFLVWTTTPYSLTGNLALCINTKIRYCVVEPKVILKDGTLADDPQHPGTMFIMAVESIKNWESKTRTLAVVQELEPGSLVGLEYFPPFDYNNHLSVNNPKVFTVLDDSYVKVDAGTGIVHLAPGMGEDDFRVCLREGLIDQRNLNTIPCPIDDKGCLTVNDSNYSGQYVKHADKNIIKNLTSQNLIWEAKTVQHSYPFCYRTDTPLIQKSISAWFIDVHSINETITNLNKDIRWVPSNVGDARFAQWLSTPRDWSFGRNRFWGTPVPLWVNTDFTEIICVGSATELEELAGLERGSITDLHREFLDDIKIPSRKNPGQFLHRINDVFDCWFESGSMPYGKFAVERKFKGSEIYDLLSGKNEELLAEFMKYFPADFIGEGLDQTRGWFYTLLVLSTILFEKSAYKNVIVNGLILSADPHNTGKWIKMSKRYKNYPNPEEVLVKYGADALRLYLLDSPVTHSEPLKFQEEGLQLKSKFLIQLFNCFQFLESEIKLLLKNKNNNQTSKFQLVQSTQIYDQWILGKLKELIDKTTKHYNEYKLYLVVPLLIEFEELFSKWYINLSKLNMKGVNGESIQKQSLSTLWTLLRIFSILISPITPFISEKIYRELNNLVDWSAESESIDKHPKLTIHLELLETYSNSLKYDPVIADKVNCMVDVVMAVRGLKTSNQISIRMKSKELVLKHLKQGFLDNVKELENELMTTIKVNEIKYQILDLESQSDLIMKFNTQAIGRIAKRDLMPLVSQLKTLSPSFFLGKETIECMGYTLPAEVWSCVPQVESNNDCLVDYTSNGLLVQLSKEIITTPMEDTMELMIKNIQKNKKEANLKVYETVSIYIKVSNPEFYELLTEDFDTIKERIRSNIFIIKDNEDFSSSQKEEWIKKNQITSYQHEYYRYSIF